MKEDYEECNVEGFPSSRADSYEVYVYRENEMEKGEKMGLFAALLENKPLVWNEHCIIAQHSQRSPITSLLFLL